MLNRLLVVFEPLEEKILPYALFTGINVRHPVESLLVLKLQIKFLTTNIIFAL